MKIGIPKVFLRTEVSFFLLLNIVYLVSLTNQETYKYTIFIFLSVVYFVYLLINIKYLFSRKNAFLLYYFFYIFVLLILGLVNNNFHSYIYADLFSFSAPLFILISQRVIDKKHFFLKTFPQIAVLLNFLALFFVVLFIKRNGFFISSFEYGRASIMSPKSILFVSLYTFPLINIVKSKNHRRIFIISMLLFVFFSFSMASRGTTIIALLLFLSTYLFNGKKKLIILKKFKFYATFVLFSVCFCVLLNIPSIKGGADYFKNRFTEENLINSYRAEEASEILKSFTFKELLFGKGLGASNKCWIFSETENGVNNVHFGWVFLILKGGVAFCMFVYSSLLYAAFKLWKNKQLRPYSLIILTIFLLEFCHTNFTNFFPLSFLFIAASSSICVKNLKSVRAVQLPPMSVGVDQRVF